MTINAEPIAIGARLPAPGSITHIPTVRTRKNVPMNSVRYFFIGQKVKFASSLVPHFINTTTFAASDLPHHPPGRRRRRPGRSRSPLLLQVTSHGVLEDVI